MHSHEAEKPLSDRDKLIRMFEHWLQHNEDHARSYEDWAGRARTMGEQEALQLLQDMAVSAREQNERLAKVVEKLKG
jgi:ferritin